MVERAAQLMAVEGFHHVMIVDPAGALVGITSSHDIVRWIVNHDRPQQAEA